MFLTTIPAPAGNRNTSSVLSKRRLRCNLFVVLSANPFSGFLSSKNRNQGFSLHIVYRVFPDSDIVPPPSSFTSQGFFKQKVLFLSGQAISVLPNWQHFVVFPWHHVDAYLQKCMRYDWHGGFGRFGSIWRQIRPCISEDSEGLPELSVCIGFSNGFNEVFASQNPLFCHWSIVNVVRTQTCRNSTTLSTPLVCPLVGSLFFRWSQSRDMFSNWGIFSKNHQSCGSSDCGTLSAWGIAGSFSPDAFFWCHL